MQAGSPIQARQAAAGDTVTAVPAGLDAMDTQVSALGARLEVLADRLRPALRPPDPMPAPAVELASVHPNRCEVAGRLFDAAAAIERLYLTVDDLLERIEL